MVDFYACYNSTIVKIWGGTHFCANHSQMHCDPVIVITPDQMRKAIKKSKNLKLSTYRSYCLIPTYSGFSPPTLEAGRPFKCRGCHQVQTPQDEARRPPGRCALSRALQPLHVKAPITPHPLPLSMKLVKYRSQLSYVFRSEDRAAALCADLTHISPLSPPSTHGSRRGI